MGLRALQWPGNFGTTRASDSPGPAIRHRLRVRIVLSLLILCVVLWLPLRHNEHILPASSSAKGWNLWTSKQDIAKVSMLYGDSIRPQYRLALETHDVHNQRFNYGMHVLQRDAAGGYWNKPTYLLALLMEELGKPEAQRLEWLMWVDADLILVNPSIPLETFLPPAEMNHIHFLGSRDHNGLNTGTFFLRVSQWSVHMLIKTLAMPYARPDVDLGNSMDQVAMSMVMSEDHGGPQNDGTSISNLQRSFMFQPREWYNTYEFQHGYEGGGPENGYMLVHFPGLENARWDHMNKWLNEVINRPHIRDVPFDRSVYAHQVPQYWKLASEAHELGPMTQKVLSGPTSEDNRQTMDQVQTLQAIVKDLLINTTYSIGPGHDMLQSLAATVADLRAALGVNATTD